MYHHECPSVVIVLTSFLITLQGGVVMRNKLSCVCLIGFMMLIASLPVSAQISTGPGGVNFDEAGNINPASNDFTPTTSINDRVCYSYGRERIF
jgi:hypothetical protein